ncbi:hypothetical protein [Nocardia brasiliensis]|nr:hypothetical protein [Nocardia brasiliensis]
MTTAAGPVWLTTITRARESSVASAVPGAMLDRLGSVSEVGL